MKHGSLFSGIGGFDLAAEWVGWENIFQVENDKFCNKVLKKNFPNVKRYGDIKEFKGKPGQCDIISGGVPCQPASIAGKRQGTKDDRWLWPEAIRIVREIKPSIAVFENPTGILSLENGRPFDRILASLEAEGYTVELFIIPACGVGAWHRRDRVWIISYNSNFRRMDREFIKNSMDRGQQTFNEITSGSKSGKNVSNTNKFNDDNSRHGTGKISQFKTSGLSGVQYWKSEPELGRVAHGIPNRVDRIKGLGNAIVPQVAFEIFKAIVNGTKEKHST